MRTVVAGLVISLVVFLGAVPPASAQGLFVELRYWPATMSWNVPTQGTSSWNTNFVGLTVRRNLNPLWSLSFNGDFGGQSNWAAFAPFDTPIAGNDAIWNINLHRNFGTGPAFFSLFAGWGSAGFRLDYGGGDVHNFRVYGPRLGGTLHFTQGPWSVMGWAAFGVGTTGQSEFVGDTGVESNPASMSDWGAKVIYTFPSSWSLDLGYRAVNLRWDGTASFLPWSNEWTGWIFGINRTLP